MEREAPELVMPEIDFGYDPVLDMAERLVEIAQRGEPVVRILYKGEPAWLISGHETAVNVLRDDKRVPAGFYFRRELDTLGHTLLQMEGEEHRAHKLFFNKLFSPTEVRHRVEALLIPTADELIDQFGDAREIDFTSAFCRRYGFNIISRLLGVPISREEEDELIETVGELIQIKGATIPPEVRRQLAQEAVKKTNERLRPLLAERRRTPCDDVISQLVDAEIDGHRVTDDEAMDFVRSFYLAGADSTGMMLGNIIAYIASRPGLKQELLDHPERRTPLIDEILRLEPVTGLLTRRAVGDTEIAGTMIPDGEMILIDVPGSNRAANHFPGQEAVRLNGHNRNHVLTFGFGAHVCLGIHLARAELKICVDRVLDRLPGLRIVGTLGRPAGTTFRAIYEGVRVGFDEILPASAVPVRV